MLSIMKFTGYLAEGKSWVGHRKLYSHHNDDNRACQGLDQYYI